MERSPAPSGCSTSSTTSTPEPFSTSYRPGERMVFQKDLCDVNTNQLAAEDVRHGYKLLQQLMVPALKKVYAVFMVGLGPDDQGSTFHTPGTQCLSLPQMKERFETSAYESITDFVKDVRDMLVAHIKYHGPEHSVAGRCEKLETVMQQRIALLPRKYKEMCSLGNTHMSYVKTSDWSTRSVRNVAHSLSGTLIQTLKREAKEHGKEMKRQRHAQREKDKETIKHDMACWEMELFADNKLEQMLSSWELPQIGLFLYLCQTPLNCEPISQCEVERMMMLSKESKAMALVMTSLLSTPHQRQHLHKRAAMPYHVWSAKLTVRLQSWYKTLADCGGDHLAAADILGIEPMYWDVVGRQRNPLVYKGFHELTFYQRIWIVKSLCEACVSCQGSLREAIEGHPSEDTKEYTLGTDSTGAMYIYFPQFCGDNLRIYRVKTRRRPGRKRANQHSVQHVSPHKVANRSASPIDVCSVPSNDTLSNSTSTASPSTSKQAVSSRSARAERLARRSAKFEDWREFKYIDSAAAVATSTSDDLTTTASTTSISATDVSKSVSDPSNQNRTNTASSSDKVTPADDGSGADLCTMTDVRSIKSEPACACSNSVSSNSAADRCCECTSQSVNCTQAKATTDKSKTCSIADSRTQLAENTNETQNITDRFGTGCADVNGASSNGNTAMQNQADIAADYHTIEAKLEGCPIKIEVPADTSMSAEELPTDTSVSAEEEELITEPPDTQTYRLICQSVEELRDLCNSFSVGRGKEVELHAELEHLLTDLVRYDYKLQLVQFKCKETMKREQDRYEEPTEQTAAEVNGEWDTEEEEEATCSHSDKASDANENEHHVDRTDHEYFAPFRETRAKPVVPKEEVKTEDELGLSIFGRRRKRRIIPNNAEDEVFPKRKTKRVSTATTTNAVAAAATATEHVKDPQSTNGVPDGFTLVKINGQLYLVPTDQLPSLLTQTYATRVQVITPGAPIKLLNPGAVKTIQSVEMLTATSPVKQSRLTQRRVKLPLSLPKNEPQILTTQVTQTPSMTTNDPPLSDEDPHKTTSLTTSAVSTPFTLPTDSTASVTEVKSESCPAPITTSSSMIFTAPPTVSSDPLGLSRQGASRSIADTKLTSTDTSSSYNIVIPREDSSSAPTSRNHNALKVPTTVTKAAKGIRLIQACSPPASLSNSNSGGSQANADKPRIIYPLNCEERLKGRLQKVSTANEDAAKAAVKHGFIVSTQSETKNSTEASRITMELPNATIQVPSSVVANLLSFTGNLPVTMSATSSTAASSTAVPCSSITSTGNASPSLAWATAGSSSATTSTAQSLPTSPSSAVGSMPKLSRLVGSPPKAATVIGTRYTVPLAPKPFIAVSAVSNAQSLAAVPGYGKVSVQRCVASKTILSTSTPVSSAAISLPHSAQVQRMTTPTKALVQGQTQHVLQVRPRAATAGNSRPVLMLAQPRVQLVTSANAQVKSPLMSAPSASSTRQVINVSPQFLRTNSQVKPIGNISLVNASVRPAAANQQQVLQLNTVGSGARVASPARLIKPAQNGAVLVQQVGPRGSTSGGVLRLTTTNHLGLGTNRLVVLKKPNGTFYVPSDQHSTNAHIPTQLAIPVKVSKPATATKTAGVPKAASSSSSH